MPTTSSPKYCPDCPFTTTSYLSGILLLTKDKYPDLTASCPSDKRKVTFGLKCCCKSSTKLIQSKEEEEV